MTITRIETGPRMSKAVIHGNTVYLAGQVATDYNGTIEKQTAEVLETIDKLLAEVGSSKEKLVTAMLYITDFDQKEGMNEAWLEWLPAEHLPTRATIGVAELGKDVLIEIVVSAVR